MRRGAISNRGAGASDARGGPGREATAARRSPPSREPRAASRRARGRCGAMRGACVARMRTRAR
ncbi:hypothetical protein BURPSPAST_J0778 [Burkholderia pseudomallei Pasteur 52237]|nr:hypothetical protein BURPSPAST_J0778 [Burkholderia pseudomallei Pasteur 52237]